MFAITKNIQVEDRKIQLFWSAKLGWWTQLQFEAKTYASRKVAVNKLAEIGDSEASVLELNATNEPELSYGAFNYYECLGL